MLGRATLKTTIELVNKLANILVGWVLKGKVSRLYPSREVDLHDEYQDESVCEWSVWLRISEINNHHQLLNYSHLNCDHEKR